VAVNADPYLRAGISAAVAALPGVRPALVAGGVAAAGRVAAAVALVREARRSLRPARGAGPAAPPRSGAA
jgi:hypothetical protein